MDYKMPELNGELLARATETGVGGLVLKPFTAAELTHGVDTALGR